ncbi:MAG TPA: methyltransferase MtaB domain-containing protein [Armatimonadota bacterium]|jgi:methanol--5-hydroxybenzimidazolylcobamide Co-methyltransferase
MAIRRHFTELAIGSVDDFLCGRCPKPVTAGRGLTIGDGTVIPEINFTLPSMDIRLDTWPEVRQQYTQMITGICQRAVDLDVPGLLVEFETLPPMTVHPEWGADITRLLADHLDQVHQKHGLKSALRLTPNDSRDHERPPRMRSGQYWDGMVNLFRRAGSAGADMLAIESTGGKEIHDEALMTADLATVVFALGVLAPRDMEFLWGEIVDACAEQGITPSGDTACGFANTALALAEQKMLPRVFAAVIRVACVPRSLVAYEMGAVGPGKDCGYENPYIKAITGSPISMEGRSAACAHLSSMGNIAQAVCDCWSNESVQNVRLLSAQAPVVSMEQLAYDCRLMNVASSPEDARKLRDWTVASDSALDPQAYVLRPDVVLKLSAEILAEPSAYLRTRRAVLAVIAELRDAQASGRVRILPTETRWLDRLSKQADALPDSEDAFIAERTDALRNAPYLPGEYGLA